MRVPSLAGKHTGNDLGIDVLVTLGDVQLSVCRLLPKLRWLVFV